MRVCNAFNELGHFACGHPLEYARSSMGDSKLKDMLLEDATILFDLVVREEKGPNPQVVPRPTEAKAALSVIRDMAASMNWDDAEAMARLRAHAREALEAFGLQMPEAAGGEPPQP